MVMFVDYSPLPREVLYARSDYRFFEIAIPQPIEMMAFIRPLNPWKRIETVVVSMEKYVFRNSSNGTGLAGWRGYEPRTGTVIVGRTYPLDAVPDPA